MTEGYPAVLDNGEQHIAIAQHYMVIQLALN